MEKLFFALLGVAIIAMMIIPPWLTKDIYPYNTAPLAQKSVDKLAERDTWQLDMVMTAPGIHIPGLIRPASGPDDKWIFFIPGNGGGQLAGGQSYLLALSEMGVVTGGWGLAVWGMRGFDSAGGAPDGQGIRQDYFQVYQRLIDRYDAKPENIHIIGFSFGTDLALFLAAELEKSNLPPASLILLSTQGLTTEKWKMRRKEWFYRWSVPDSYDLGETFKQIRMPVMIVESENDLLGDSSYLLGALQGETNYLVLPDGNHVSSLNATRALQAVSQWVMSY